MQSPVPDVMCATGGMLWVLDGVNWCYWFLVYHQWTQWYEAAIAHQLCKVESVSHWIIAELFHMQEKRSCSVVTEVWSAFIETSIFCLTCPCVLSSPAVPLCLFRLHYKPHPWCWPQWTHLGICSLRSRKNAEESLAKGCCVKKVSIDIIGSEWLGCPCEYWLQCRWAWSVVLTYM